MVKNEIFSQDEYFTFEELSEIIDAPRNNKEYIGEAFDENDNIESKNISPSDWKKIKSELKQNGIDSSDLNFKSIYSKIPLKKEKEEKFLDAYLLIPVLLLILKNLKILELKKMKNV